MMMDQRLSTRPFNREKDSTLLCDGFTGYPTGGRMSRPSGGSALWKRHSSSFLSLFLSTGGFQSFSFRLDNVVDRQSALFFRETHLEKKNDETIVVWFRTRRACSPPDEWKRFCSVCVWKNARVTKWRGGFLFLFLYNFSPYITIRPFFPKIPSHKK